MKTTHFIPLIFPSVCLLSFFCSSLNAQPIITVPGNQPTIKAAIAAAPNGAIINVSPGTYRENRIDLLGKRITLQSTSGAANTIIDGGGKYTIFEVKRGETLSTQIIGFTIQNGNGGNAVSNPWTDTKGQLPGAVAVYAFSPDPSKPPISSSITIKNCVFKNNKTVLIESRPGELAPPLRPLASREKGFSGGAIRITGGGTLVLSGNTFSNNSASSNGGAVEVALSSAKIVGNKFFNNKTGYNGGGLKVTPKVGGFLEVNSNTFVGNIARGLGNPINSGGGGGMQISCGGQAPGKAGIDFFSFVSNNTFSGNIARFAGGGISVFGANVKIASNTFTNNNPDFPTNPDRWYDPNDVSNSLTGVYGGAIHLETHQGIGGNRNFQIVGNTITGNKVRSQGGGILLYLENTTCSVLISGNKIISNRAEYPGKIYTSPAVVDPYGGQKMGQGGGLLISAPSKNFSTGVTTPNNSVITVSGNTINANTAQDFAAGQFSGGKYSIRNNTVDSNTAIFRHGGLVFQMNGDLNISGNSVKNNKVADIYKNGVSDRAGGIYVADLRDTTGLMANNTFTNNRGRLAGAVYLSKSVGRLDLTGNTFTNNVTVARDDKGRAISGSFTADGGSVVPSGVATVVSSNTFTGDVFGLSFFNYTTPKINVSNNAFSSSTSGVARAKLNGGLTMDYLTVNALNATAFASGNTGTP